jgi:iron-sulfur cluster repair protein YtfE (RIC family)
MEFDATQIRKVILDEHSLLRDELKDIRNLLEEVAVQHREAGARLHHRMVTFYDAFLRHIAHEESLLRPVLADVDAWGPARVEKMDDEHRQQRATIAALTMLDPGLQEEGNLGRIRAFVTEVERDMAVEEREGLSPDVLRDDTIVIDSFTG